MRSSVARTRPPWRRSPAGSPRSAAGSRSPASADDVDAGIAPGGAPGVRFFAPDAGDTVPFLIVAFVAAAIVSFVLTPLVRRAAIRFDAIDHPDAPRVNVRPV